MSDKPGMTPADRLALKGIAVLLVGTLALIHGCSRFMLGGGHVIGAEVAEGAVVEIREYKREVRAGRGLASFQDVFVEYPLGDRHVRVRDSVGATGERPAKGDRVKVYFDPQAPEKAMIGGNAPFTGMQYLAEWLAGIAAMAAAVLLIVRAGRLKRKEAKANAKEGKEAT